MKFLRIICKSFLLMMLTTALLFFLLWAGDKALPIVIDLPVYSPSLAQMGIPGEVNRFVSNEFDYIVRNNSLGLRGPDIEPDKKKAFRIAVYGSSYTYGWGVNEEDCFVFKVGDILKEKGLDVEMVNLGRNGGAPGQYAALAGETIPLLKPDMVIVAVGQGCDLTWSGPPEFQDRYSYTFWKIFPNITAWRHKIRQKRSYIFATTTQIPTDDEMQKRKEEIAKIARRTYDEYNAEQKARFDLLDEDVKEVFFSGHLNIGVLWLSMYYPDLYVNALEYSRPELQQSMRWLSTHFDSIAKTAGRFGIPVLVISVPYGSYVNRTAWENARRMGFNAVPEMLSSTAMDESIQEAAHGLPFFSASDTFRAQMDNPNLFFKYDLHMAAEGHVLFAHTLAPWVEAHVRTSMNTSEPPPETNE